MAEAFVVSRAKGKLAVVKNIPQDIEQDVYVSFAKKNE
jgi:hypothetical protein